jgi:hypothetical protein
MARRQVFSCYRMDGRPKKRQERRPVGGRHRGEVEHARSIPICVVEGAADLATRHGDLQRSNSDKSHHGRVSIGWWLRQSECNALAGYRNDATTKGKVHACALSRGDRFGFRLVRQHGLRHGGQRRPVAGPIALCDFGADNTGARSDCTGLDRISARGPRPPFRETSLAIRTAAKAEMICEGTVQRSLQ